MCIIKLQHKMIRTPSISVVWIDKNERKAIAVIHYDKSLRKYRMDRKLGYMMDVIAEVKVRIK